MKTNVINKVALGLLVITLCLVSIDLVAQCPMCRVAAESNLANGGSEGKGLNTGILYMLAIPYVLVLGLGYVWWRNNGRHHADADSQ